MHAIVYPLWHSKLRWNAERKREMASLQNEPLARRRNTIVLMEAEVAAAATTTPAPAVLPSSLSLLPLPPLPLDSILPSYDMVIHAGGARADACEVWCAINYIVMSMWAFGEYKRAPVILLARVIAFEFGANSFWLHGLRALDAFSQEAIAWPAEQPRRWRQQLHFPNRTGAPPPLPFEPLAAITRDSRTNIQLCGGFWHRWCFRHDLLAEFHSPPAAFLQELPFAMCAHCARLGRHSILGFGMEVHTQPCLLCGHGGGDDPAQFEPAAVSSQGRGATLTMVFGRLERSAAVESAAAMSRLQDEECARALLSRKRAEEHLNHHTTHTKVNELKERVRQAHNETLNLMLPLVQRRQARLDLRNLVKELKELQVIQGSPHSLTISISPCTVHLHTPNISNVISQETLNGNDDDTDWETKWDWDERLLRDHIDSTKKVDGFSQIPAEAGQQTERANLECTGLSIDYESSEDEMGYRYTEFDVEQKRCKGGAGSQGSNRGGSAGNGNRAVQAPKISPCIQRLIDQVESTEGKECWRPVARFFSSDNMDAYLKLAPTSAEPPVSLHSNRSLEPLSRLMLSPDDIYM